MTGAKGDDGVNGSEGPERAHDLMNGKRAGLLARFWGRLAGIPGGRVTKWLVVGRRDGMNHMSPESRLTAGILLILMPAVVYGGVSILSLLVGDPQYTENQLRQDLWRAGHAHAGVLLVLSLVTLRYVDEARLPNVLKRLARHSIPASAILLPAAFFLSVASPEATKPNALIYLAYVGAVSLAVGLLVLGVGLIRAHRTSREGDG